MARSQGISRQAVAPAAVGLVIFDFDGVVADSEVLSLSSLQTALREFGIDLTLNEVRRRFLGIAVDKIKRDVETESPGGTSVGFSRTWHDALFDMFRRELRPVPGLVDLLGRIEARGVPYCIASSSTFERIGVALDAMGLAGQFTHVFSSEVVENGKPAPDLFLHAAKEFSVSPGNCLVVEDSPHGIRAAKAAGMRVIGFLGGAHLEGIRDEHRRILLAQDADGVVESLNEIMVDGVRGCCQTNSNQSQLGK
jgi:HAD superfamily hydrolase (TIGR01509 family)